MEKLAQISCSRCGASRVFQYSAANVLNLVYTEGWRNYGSALYCPGCSATWDERNKGRPLPAPDAAVRVIDEWYHRSKRRYRP